MNKEQSDEILKRLDLWNCKQIVIGLCEINQRLSEALEEQISDYDVPIAKGDAALTFEREKVKELLK